MVKEADKDEAFEHSLKDDMGWGCSCSQDILNKKSSLSQSTCKGCGKLFKTNRDVDYCFECKEIFYDEP
jgi:hypothetical protein